VFDDLIGRAGEVFDTRIRLGVTGLSRAGKTVFITALVANLLAPLRLSRLTVVAEKRLRAAVLQPQPDPDIARFDLESALAALTGPVPHWPAGTRRLSELRVSLRVVPGAAWRRGFGDRVVHLDIFDYPGEWLLDLPMLRQDYATWARQSLAALQNGARAQLSTEYRALLQGVDAAKPADDALARQLADRYTAFLQACRNHDQPLSRMQPGRFLLPGDAEGSPMLTFAPVPEPSGGGARGSLWRLMSDRFDAYRDRLVRPFFTDHFAKLDAQVVLVDMLDHLGAGAESLGDLRAALTDILACFKHGSGGMLETLLGPLFGPRVSRVLFAATKADHVPRADHEALASLAKGLLDEAERRTAFSGARTRAMALASIRATTEVEARDRGGVLSCVQGVPLAGGPAQAVYPGRLPTSLSAADGGGRFRAPRFAPPAGLNPATGMPHLGLDSALQFLIGEALA
jgi:uncharacterized protein